MAESENSSDALYSFDGSLDVSDVQQESADGHQASETPGWRRKAEDGALVFNTAFSSDEEESEKEEPADDSDYDDVSQEEDEREMDVEASQDVDGKGGGDHDSEPKPKRPKKRRSRPRNSSTKTKDKPQEPLLYLTRIFTLLLVPDREPEYEQRLLGN